MGILKGACIIGQSGGPTSVINSSALGVIQTALKSEAITNVYAAAHGITGVLDEKMFDCSKEDPAELELFKNTPASQLGSCRYKLKDFNVDDSEYVRILEVFKKYDVRYFFYNGGNDSMDTCNKISKYMAKVGYECRVMGIPKTIDNDLFGTDHCPGYGSAAKYVATACAEVYCERAVYPKGMIIVMEVMGRNAGWLTAAAGLAGVNGTPVDLIYLPERVFDMDKFIADIKRVYAENGSVLVAVSEGIKDADGKFVSEYGAQGNLEKDAFGHSQMGGLASVLANVAKKEVGVKTRGIEFSLLQRCGASNASAVDIAEAYLAGESAVKYAIDGITDKMVGFEREAGDKYVCKVKLIDLDVTANAENKFPDSMINAEGNGITQEYIDYALPLIQGEAPRITENGLPRYPRLKKVFV